MRLFFFSELQVRVCFKVLRKSLRRTRGGAVRGDGGREGGKAEGSPSGGEQHTRPAAR